ncbi:Rrf2 family transcriptional regulator [Cellulomonas chitinilytica]|uniref:Rrf2 family transcriptional regulator n=1 Tax=Cellulomonas chitinilytica TaxID=398759 RepID=A0A919P0R1_9CELL|nr:Rrf2 family transcriptional regulator [Cellulomonas chitinilytica]GIG19546.1 Rrf2 family transcriptional regulator [Cellulomonas chitinilytica]
MHISAKSDYAIRAALEIAQREPDVVTADTIAGGQGLPRTFVVSILADLRRAGLVRAHRGSSGGYVLTRPASDVTLGSIIRAVDGPLGQVHGLRPDEVEYPGVAEHLPDVWVAVRSSLRLVLDGTTLQHALTGRLPAPVARMRDAPGAREPRAVPSWAS